MGQGVGPRHPPLSSTKIQTWISWLRRWNSSWVQRLFSSCTVPTVRLNKFWVLQLINFLIGFVEQTCQQPNGSLAAKIGAFLLEPVLPELILTKTSKKLFLAKNRNRIKTAEFFLIKNLFANFHSVLLWPDYFNPWLCGWCFFLTVSLPWRPRGSLHPSSKPEPSKKATGIDFFVNRKWTMYIERWSRRKGRYWGQRYFL